MDEMELLRVRERVRSTPRGVPGGRTLFRAVGPQGGVENSLYERATGYSYNAVKIVLPYGSREPVYAPYTEHVPPDVTACIFWLKNRDPGKWRDAWQLEHVTGKYVVSDKTLTEDEWIAARGADVIEGEVVSEASRAFPKASSPADSKIKINDLAADTISVINRQYRLRQVIRSHTS
jgi:hypothetical protein